MPIILLLWTNNDETLQTSVILKLNSWLSSYGVCECVSFAHKQGFEPNAPLCCTKLTAPREGKQCLVQNGFLGQLCN